MGAAFQPREYQAQAARAVLGEWEGGRRRTLLVLPTGTGKTCVFAMVAAEMVRRGHRVLVLAHRGELLDQAAEKLSAVAGLSCNVERAEQRCTDGWERVTVASVQTLQRPERLERLPRGWFGCIVVDEAHHALADGYRRILDWFSDAKVLGVTATADRGDRQDLGAVFESLAYEYPLARAVAEGHLVPIRAQTVPLHVELEGVAVHGGDFQAAGLGRALDPYLEAIADEVAARAAGRRTVAFLPLVDTARRFAAMLSARGLRAAEVDGASQDRADVLGAFSDGRLDVLCNAMLLTEGWDCPAVDCVVVLRPTKVRSLYAQMVGRGTRPAPGKGHLLLLDFLWHVERHRLCRPACLVTASDEAQAQAERIMADGAERDVLALAAQAEADAVEQREAAMAEELARQRRKKARLVDVLQYETSIQAEDLAGYVPAFGWEARPPTDAQVAALEAFGLDPTAAECAGKASALLDRLSQRAEAGLSTPKQIRFLEARGFHRVGTWTKAEASAMIARISTNGWRVPRGVDPAAYVPERREA